MLTMTEILARGLNADPLPTPPAPTPPGSSCAITGEPLQRGYLASEVVSTKSTGNLLDVLHGLGEDWMSDSAARLYSGRTTANLGSRLVFEDGTAYHPLIARPKATDRSYWSALARQVWPDRRGQPCVAILATDPKKRVWPLARLGALGAQTPVTIYDPEQNLLDTLFIDWPAMLAELDVIETIYSAGFSKRAICTSLFSDFKRTQEAGYALTRDWERQLSGWRGSNEFVMATLIAQKETI